MDRRGGLIAYLSLFLYRFPLVGEGLGMGVGASIPLKRNQTGRLVFARSLRAVFWSNSWDKEIWSPRHIENQTMPLDELEIPVEHLDVLREHVRSAVPNEACGFLGGVQGRVRGVFPVPNIAPDPSGEFLMEPQAQWNAMRTLSERGWDVLAIYHSHPPGGQAEPSGSDVVAAYYPEALTLLIVPDLSGRISSLRAFAIDAGRVSEVSIVVKSQNVIEGN
jgi:[CysO sulfur-carrier protein]-S-L-cysteine hydrolase